MAKEIGNLNVIVGLDATGFQNGIGNLNREMKKVQSEFKLASTEMGKGGKSLDSLKLKSDSLTKQVELQRQKVDALSSAHQTSVDSKGKDAKATQELEIKLNKAKTQLSSMEQSLQRTNQEIELQSSSFYKLGKALEPVGKSFQDVGKKMESVGKDLTTKLTLPLTGLGTASAKIAIDFESAFAGVRKTTDATEAEFEKLENGIRDMAMEIPASADEIAGVAEAAGQLGIQTENILGFSRVMIDLGESTNMSADEAATSLARLANITGMSQTDFDRLGSTIVDLGNSLATTEGEIVAMGLRLAGAGSQIGLTEAEIMSFAGALSSVGIEAEAGGSAFSKVMIEMQLAVETGSEKLHDFAQVAGMSADEFSTAFRDDAAGAIITFIEGLGNAEEEGLSAIKVLDDMGIKEVRLRDALLRASGASDVFTDSLALGSQAWEENTALTNEAGQRYETTASQIEIAKNYLKDAGITIGEILVPYLVEMVEEIKNAAQWFSDLNPETQETIVKVGALVAALGPLLVIGGKVTSGAGTIITAFSKASISLAGLKTGATAAATASSGLASGFSVTGLAAKAGALLLNPWVLGIGAATVAGVALYKHLSEDSIPAIEVFGDEVSEATQEAVGGFLELSNDATLALNQLSWSGQEVTAEMAESLIGKYDQMNSQILSSMQERHTEQLTSTKEYFDTSSALTAKEEAEALSKLEEYQAGEQAKVEEGQTRIAEILNIAKDEKRAITDAEREEINGIQTQMTETAVKVLSESEVEQLAIMESLRSQSSQISARQAAEVVQNSLKQKEETIQNANEQYVKTVAEIEALRDEAGVISEDQADKLIEEAKRQRDESVKSAEKMHEDVVKEAKVQAKEHVNQVDWETGEVMSKWQVMKRDVSTKVKDIKDDVISKWEDIKKDSSEKWESIKTDLASKWSSMKSDTTSKVKDIKNDVLEKWEAIKTSTEENWGKVKTAVSDSIENVKTKVSEGIEKIKEWNNTSVKEKVFSIVEKVKSIFTSDKVDSNFAGTSFFQGGLTMVGELGPELVALPKGSRIYNHNVTKDMLSGDKGITQNIVINSPSPLSPGETARQIKNASRQLALEW